MKKNVFVLLFLIVVNSCSDAITASSEIKWKTWQEQLEYAKNTNLGTKTAVDDLCLVNYTYKGMIENKGDIPVIVDDLFSENSAIIQYESSGFSDFNIVTIGTLFQMLEIPDDSDPFSDLRTRLKSIIEIGMELVELEWTFKGKTYYSTAIVSNKYGGVLYDNIGTYAIRSTCENISEEEPRLHSVKSRSESSEPAVRHFSMSNSGTNYLGIEVYSYSITCTSYFNEQGILYDRVMNANHDSAWGWSCNSAINTINGDINVSTYHEFAWAYAYSASCTVSIGWHGNGFSISPGSTGASGTEIHRR